ncbi:thermonuclease family protein [Mesorhizobium sp. IMUNJ 23232]|uniref:thermonuclease family protein n=1 Tax=Mesorhizobium sp. IMUNJ 23232 TaxID=3376064 RepID=UPI003799311F
MRSPAILLGAAAVMLGVGLLVVAGGNILRSKAEVSAEAIATTGSAEKATDDGVARKPITTERPVFKSGAERQSISRPVTPDEAEESPAETGGLERVGPRAALSDIGQALPPKPKRPDEWKGITLFQPVATAAGLIEAKGYRIAVAGIEPVRPEETCDSAGKSWPCGMRARAAFRAWLRGRSITCEIPPEPDREIVVAPCQVGKEDVAGWLVESGWARAAGGSEYVALGETAAQARKGIFGRPPSTSAPAQSAAGSALPAPPASDTAIQSGPLTEPAPDVVAPDPGVSPPVLDGPLGEFPTPPAPPPAPAE